MGGPAMRLVLVAALVLASGRATEVGAQPVITGLFPALGSVAGGTRYGVWSL